MGYLFQVTINIKNLNLKSAGYIQVQLHGNFFFLEPVYGKPFEYHHRQQGFHQRFQKEGKMVFTSRQNVLN